MRISDWSSDVCSSDLACCSFKGFQPRFLRALAGAASRAAIFCRRAAIFCRFLPVEEKVADLLEFSGKIFDPNAFLIVFAGALLIALLPVGREGFARLPSATGRASCRERVLPYV